MRVKKGFKEKITNKNRFKKQTINIKKIQKKGGQ